MQDFVAKAYGGKIRQRVGGICLRKKIGKTQILLIKHQGLGKPYFWIPPGGGIEFGETAKNALCREFLEETGLIIEIQKFLGISEFLNLPLHTYELFFMVDVKGGNLKQGIDPETDIDKQVIQKISWLSLEELAQIPEQYKHPILHNFDEKRLMNFIQFS